MTVRRRLFNLVIPTCNLLQSLVKVLLVPASRISGFIKLAADFLELVLGVIQLLLQSV